MADVNANIDINIDSSNAVANLRRLELAINDYQRNIASANTAAANSSAALNRALVDGINNTGMFSAKIAPATDSVGRFTTALEKNKLSLGEYTKYAASQLPGLSRVFRREFDTMQQVAESRVKKMQTQYIALGKTVDGTAKSISMMPRGLAPGYATDVALATQRHQMFNKMIDDGSTKLLNWGKNTQWAGRQLMVGFSIPLAALGVTASKTFMEIDKATTSLKRVYGDLSTTSEEVNKNIDAINALGKEYTKYGIALSDTVNVAATAAAAGMKNEQLTANTKESLRLATLGQIDYQQALTTTITLQNAFGTSNKELAPTVDFIGAVANQTVLSVDDLTNAIPRVAPVIKGLGGNVKDLAVLLVAMREGGVSAEQGANALKSGLANLINPTKAASKAAAQYNIDLQGIVNANRGDIMGTIKSLATALSTLDSFSRQQVLEKIFGKYQFARIGALFDHINEKTGQVKQAMDLLGMSTEDLAKVSDKSLSAISESTTVKFQAALEQLKISIAPLGQAFLKGVTPIINMVSKIADAFNNLPDGIKNAVAVIIAAVAGIGPIILMSVGLLANGFANIIKVVQVFRKGLAGIRGDGDSFKYLSSTELEAAAATDALEGSVHSLTGKLLLQKGAVSSLTQEYLRFIDVAGVASSVSGIEGFAGARVGGATKASATRVSKQPLRMATGGIVPGTGNGDTIPALLTPGESVITKEATQKYAPILHQMNKGTLPGFSNGFVNLFKKQSAIVGGIRKTGTRSSRMNWEEVDGVIPYAKMERQNPESSRGIFWNNALLPEETRNAGINRSANGTVLGHVYSNQFYSSRGSSSGAASPRQFGRNLGYLRSSKRLRPNQTYDLLANQYIIFDRNFNEQLNQKNGATKEMWKNVGGKDMVSLIMSLRSRGVPEDIAMQIAERAAKTLNERISRTLGPIDEMLFGRLATGASVQALKSSSKLLKPFEPQKLFGGKISIGEALKTWQTSARQVRENPEALAAIMGGMQQSSTSQTLHRSTTLGLGRGSEFNPQESAILFEALRSGNVGSLVGREFSIDSPVSYTAGGLGGTLGALAQNTDVNRINSLINQLYQRKNRRIDDLKMLARARKNLAAGIMPELNQKIIQELEQKTEKTKYLAEQKRLQQQIKELAPRGYQNVVFEQRFPKGSPLLDVNAATGGVGTYMGKNVAHEQEFISPGSRVKVVDVQVDPKTGLTKIITEALPMKFASGGIVPGTGNKDTIPALLTPGESVINKKATQKYAPILHQMNQGTLRGFALGDEDIQTSKSRSRAPGNIQRQTKEMTWDTRQAEIEILRAAGLAITNASSHIVPPEAGQPKIWKAGFLQADLQELNHYIDKTKEFAKKAMSEQETVAKIVSATGLSEKEVIKNLDYFSKGVHATTRESAMVLKELAAMRSGTTDAAIASVLSTRLGGNYYETLGDRKYKSFGNPITAYTPEQLMGITSMQAQSKKSELSGVTVGLPNAVHKELKKQAREELIQSGKFAGTAEDQERAVQQRYFKLVQQREGKLRARLIAEERDFLISRGVEKQLATALARRADIEGRLGVAAAKAEQRMRVGAGSRLLSPSESSPVLLGMPTMPTGRGRNPKPTRSRSFGKVGAGVGLAAGLASSVLPMMMADQNGKVLGMDAGMLSMVSTLAVPALTSGIGKIAAPMFAEGGALAGAGGPVTLAIAAAAAATAGSLYLWRKHIDDSAKETANLTANLGVTANSVQEMGKILGKSTPQERMKLISAGFTGVEQQKLQENVIPSLQSQEGQNLIAQLKSSSPIDRSKKLEDYLNSAIATRMMNKEDAQIFARAVGVELKDGLMGMRVAKNVLGQAEGSQGMLGISEQRLKALKSDLRIQQVVVASGESRTITADAAAAAIGGAVQGFQDLGNVIALTQEDYQNGKISLEQYNKTMDEVSQAQKQYSSWLNKSIGGSMEFGGSMQALTDQMVATGRFTQDQIDAFHHSLDIGTGGFGTTAFETSILEKRKLTDPRYAAALKGTGIPQVVQTKGMPEIGVPSSKRIMTQTQEDLDYIASVKAEASKALELYSPENQNKIEANLIGNVLQNKISLEEAQSFVEFLKSGSKDAITALEDLAKGADSMTIVFTQMAKSAGKTDLYINTGKKFMAQGGDISAYQSFFENKSVDGRREAALNTFNRLDFAKQMSQLKDYTAMSSQLGSESSAGLINTFLYRKAQSQGNTSAITNQASKAEKAGVGTAFGNIAADLSVKDNGKQVPVNEWIKSTDIVIKQLQNWNKGNKEQKKKALLTILSQTTMNGKNLTSAQAQDAYKQLINQFGEAQIINLPDDQITKVVDIQMLINKNAVAQLEAEAELRKAMASGNQDAITAAGLKLYALSQQAQSYGGSTATVTNENPVPNARTKPNGTGGGKLNFFQQFEKDTNAQAQMFPGLMNKLKSKFPNIPKAILDMIGSGAQGKENLQSLLNADGKRVAAVIAKYTKNTIGESARAIQDEITANNKKVQAIASMKAAGYSENQVQTALSSDSFMQELDAMGNTSDAAKKLKSQIDALTASQKAVADASMTAEQALQNQRDAMQKDADIINNALAKQEDQIKIDNAAKFLADNGMTTDEMHHQIDANNRIIQQEQDKINAKQSQIDSLNRQNELNNRISDALSHDLDIMSQQEQKIRETYQKRIDALNKVAEINDHIAQQQQDQIGLAKALSEGDVYAAAQAAEQMQKNQIDYARKQQQDALQTGMQNAVDNLRTPSGLTRKQAEQQINAAKEQSYQIGLKIRNIQDEIYTIQNGQMKTLQDQNEQYSKKLQYNDEDLNWQLQTADFQGHSRQWWKDHLDYLSNAMTKTGDIVGAMQRLIGLMNQYNAGMPSGTPSIGNAGSQGNGTLNPSTGIITYPNGSVESSGSGDIGSHFGPGVVYSPGTAPAFVMATGGMVPRYYASGGHVNMDSVPAMLTPGEFVMRKSAVNRYGKGTLSDMNTGRFNIPKPPRVSSPSFKVPTYDTNKMYAGGNPNFSEISGKVNNSNTTHAPVYNTYSVSVPVSQPGASADDIANKVMMKIKSIESNSIRRVNGY